MFSGCVDVFWCHANLGLQYSPHFNPCAAAGSSRRLWWLTLTLGQCSKQISEKKNAKKTLLTNTVSKFGMNVSHSS